MDEWEKYDLRHRVRLSVKPGITGMWQVSGRSEITDLPQQDTPLLYGLTVVTVLGSITAGAMQPVYYIYTLTVKNKIPCWVTIAGGFLNVVAMYFLLKYTYVGPYAIVVTTAVIMISINVFFNPTYAARCLNVSSFILYPTIFRHLISCGVMTIVFRFMSKIAHR